jgi:type III pantothenate kinase
MLLALDAGNTNVTIGIFEDSTLLTSWRLNTVRDQTADEWGIKLRSLFAVANIDPRTVSGVAISSVVPPIDQPLAEVARRYFRTEPVFVSVDRDLGLEVRIDNPREAGADRLANAAAAFHKYGGPCVVVDMGTAINFDVVSREGHFLGGIICPGIGIAISGLFEKAARLPLVDFRAPRKLIGTNTVDCIQSGLYYSTIGAIDGILARLAEELGPDMRAVGTGGQVKLITEASRYLKIFDADLTLEGVRLIWERNVPR